MTTSIPRRLAASGGERLDAFVASAFGIERLEARRWIVAGAVSVEGRSIKPSLRLEPGAVVSVTPPALRASEAQPEDLSLTIVYQDEAVVVIDKPAGMATHPGPGWWHGSAVNALLYAISEWPGIGGVAQPGIVHRLDRDTSGLLVFAKTDDAHAHLLKQAYDRRLRRTYLAWVEGDLMGSGLIEAPLGRDPMDGERVIVTEGGKPARTRYQAIASGPSRSLVRLELETGRTHQIRVHLLHLGHPVLADPRYHPYPGVGPMALHAWRLGFEHPLTHEPLAFELAPPSSWSVYAGGPSLG